MNDLPPVIHIVDDDASFRSATARLLRASGYRAELYDSGSEFLEDLPGVERGCILLDVRMAGLSGLQVQDRLAELGHPLPIIFLTGHGDIPASVRAIKAGAEDFLTKPVTSQTLLDAVRRALARYEMAEDQRNRHQALEALATTLTPREREVFALVASGKLNKQIAHALGTSERTIKAHRHNVMAKLQAGSIAQLVSIAEQLGAGAAPSASTLGQPVPPSSRRPDPLSVLPAGTISPRSAPA